jgi:hypothetical protein
MLLLSVCQSKTLRQVVITEVMFYVVSLYETIRCSMVMKQCQEKEKSYMKRY